MFPVTKEAEQIMNKKGCPKKVMPELIDIIVDEPIIKEKVVMVQANINYEGNSFSAWGIIAYAENEGPQGLQYAIEKAQNKAIKNVKNLIKEKDLV